jgi:hypothetical protein
LVFSDLLDASHFGTPVSPRIANRRDKQTIARDEGADKRASHAFIGGALVGDVVNGGIGFFDRLSHPNLIEHIVLMLPFLFKGGRHAIQSCFAGDIPFARTTHSIANDEENLAVFVHEDERLVFVIEPDSANIGFECKGS